MKLTEIKMKAVNSNDWVVSVRHCPDYPMLGFNSESLLGKGDDGEAEKIAEEYLLCQLTDREIPFEGEIHCFYEYNGERDTFFKVQSA